MYIGFSLITKSLSVLFILVFLFKTFFYTSVVIFHVQMLSICFCPIFSVISVVIHCTSPWGKSIGFSSVWLADLRLVGSIKSKTFWSWAIGAIKFSLCSSFRFINRRDINGPGFPCKTVLIQSHYIIWSVFGTGVCSGIFHNPILNVNLSDHG